MQKKKPPIHGITFRVSQDMLDILETHARDKKISLNMLANQIFKNYVEWDSIAVNAGWMVFPKPTLKELVDRANEKELEIIAKNKADYDVDIRLFMMGSNDIEGFLSMLRHKCSRSGFPYSENTMPDGTVHFMIQHDMGTKWSFFYKVLYAKTLKDLGYSVKIKASKNTIALKIPSR